MAKNDKVGKLQILVNMSALINSTLDPAEIKNKSIESIKDLLDVEEGSFLIRDEESGMLTFEVATGEKGEKLKSISLQKGEGIAGSVAESGQPLVINDVRYDVRFFREADQETGFKTRSVICVPVMAKHRIIGVLEGINKKSGAFTDDDLYLMNSLANVVAVAYENARLYEELKETFYSTIEALADMIELRDPYTGGHIKRVMKYSLIIGKCMGLERDEIEALKLAAIFHDIGKIGVGDEVLLKGGKLSPRDLQVIKRHPVYGSEVLSHIKQLRKVIPGVKFHHERYDGKGYPEGLKGDKIPLIARIISVADTFDALTTDRPYKKAMSCEEALDELKESSGKQFDARVVHALMAGWETKRWQFEAKSSWSIRV